MFNPMANGVGGWSRFNRLSLDWRVPMFSNGSAAKFWGKMREDLGRTEIRGRFGAPRFLQAFVLVWYSVITAMFVSLFAAWLGNDMGTSTDVMGLFIVPAFGLMPLLLILVFNRGAERHFEEILDFLERIAEARTAP
jgi:hypothetical protein